MSFVIDTFTDTGGTAFTAHTPDVGGDWFAHPSSIGTPVASIASNRLAGSWGLYGAYYNDETPPSADYRVTVDVQRDGTIDTGSGGGVFARLQTTAPLDGILVRMRSNGFYLEIFDGTGGGPVATHSVSYTPATGVDYRLTLDVSGNDISVKAQRQDNSNWINSSGSEVASEVNMISVTDSTVTAAGHVGIAGRLAIYNFDNFGTGQVQEFTENVSQSLGLSQEAGVKAFRRPLYINANNRIARIPDGDFVSNVEPSEFLVQVLSDTDSATYYYYGGLDSDGGWKINRILKTDLNSRQSATIANNGSYGTLSAAWTDRASLNYA